jgi:hypothetical protein
VERGLSDFGTDPMFNPWPRGGPTRCGQGLASLRDRSNVWVCPQGGQAHAEHTISAEQRLEPEIKPLIGASRKRLKETWRSVYGSEAPYKMSADHLRRAIAYRLHERALGGLKPTRELLERMADDRDASRFGSKRRSPTVGAGVPPMLARPKGFAAVILTARSLRSRLSHLFREQT